MNISGQMRRAQAQTQVQKLSPQMRQGLAMLAKSLPELREELYREMATNPAIEDIEQTIEQETVSHREHEEEIAERPFDDGYPEDDSAPDESWSYDADALERRRRFLESRTREETLEEHLIPQIAVSDIAPGDAPLAEILIGELDDDGYFRGSIPDIMMVSGESEEKIREILAAIRDFDPAGCGATTLEECLLAQLDKLDGSPAQGDVRAILEGRRLSDIAAGRGADVARDLGIDAVRLSAAMEALRTLDPRPARAYGRSGRNIAYVNPEVHAVRSGGRWIARVDGRSLPEIRISPRYRRMLHDPSLDPEAKRYIAGKIAAAEMLSDAVEKREETVSSIAQAIFDAQPGFFREGLKGLRPLTMQEIADKTGVHHTTVSRTVRDKYASTPRGTVELRRFFVSGYETEDGGQISQTAVLDALKGIVAGEDASAPFSDEKLSALLRERGCPVARRTVAKYRGMLGIPGAAERRRPGSAST